MYHRLNRHRGAPTTIILAAITDPHDFIIAPYLNGEI